MSDSTREALENDWLARLVKAERENHCGDAACMTRRVSAAVRVLTGGKEHQDYCWAIEAFEAELGVRDPALVGAEPSNAMLAAALSTTPAPDHDALRLTMAEGISTRLDIREVARAALEGAPHDQ